MNEYLSVLRALMPESYVQRGDQSSIVSGAINYVKELEQQLQFLWSMKQRTVASSFFCKKKEPLFLLVLCCHKHFSKRSNKSRMSPSYINRTTVYDRRTSCYIQLQSAALARCNNSKLSLEYGLREKNKLSTLVCSISYCLLS
ncbi:hypothetical protein H5410_054997 [Solanum commersonii]|uniref:BHLH domain-containing protein n=1 Tax=Solanum commersonii TaxID=4109 RepID=A0A9J5WHQ4_SOLCO|nr:hypothetical protein H5410_054997 [Solanum commersonii]